MIFIVEKGEEEEEEEDVVRPVLTN